MQGKTTQYTRNYKPTLYCGLVTTVTLVSLTVFHFSKLVIVFEKPKIYPLHQLRSYDNHSFFFEPQHEFNQANLPANVSSNCSPKNNIFFLKTHKTASTTVQNIILRYATKHNLSVALPARISHLFPLDKPFEVKFVLKPQPWADGYNILCHHLIYNKNEVEKVLPQNSVFISIIRDPTSVFESLYEYENFKEEHGLTLAEFAKLTADETGIKKLQKKFKKIPQNPLCNNFGVTVNEISDIPKLEEAINKIEKKFNLVMITEHFDESIILMKELLCWDIKDVVSFSNNARAPKFHTNLTQNTIQLLKKWNYADQILYDHFKKIFTDILEQRANDLKLIDQVKKLQMQRQELYDVCIDQQVPSSKMKDFKFWSTKVLGYKLKVRNSTCVNMVKPEVVFTKDIRKKQMQFMNKFLQNIGISL